MGWKGDWQRPKTMVTGGGGKGWSAGKTPQRDGVSSGVLPHNLITVLSSDINFKITRKRKLGSSHYKEMISFVC